MIPSPLLAALNAHPDLPRLGTVPLTDLSFSAAEQAFLTAHRPEHILLVYGTLAPGRPNYAVIEPVGGEWRPVTIRGELVAQGWGADLGYPGFRLPTTEAAGETIAAVGLFAEQLVAHWPRLDAFEGEGYHRILLPFELTDGTTGIGFIYALQEG